MRQRSSAVLLTLAAVLLGSVGIVSAAQAEAPTPAYTYAGTVPIPVADHALQSDASPALVGEELFLARDHQVLAAHIETGETRAFPATPYSDWVRHVATHDGLVYVGRNATSAIDVYDTAGTLVRTIPGESGSGITSLTVAEDGTVFAVVRSVFSGYVLEARPDGTTRRLLEDLNCGSTFHPMKICDPSSTSIAVDDDHIYLSVYYWGVVTIHSRTGAHQATLEEPRRQFITAGQRSIAAHDGLVYLTTYNKDEIDVFEPAAEGGKPTLVKRASLTDDSALPRLRSAHSRPVVTDDGRIILANSSGSTASRGNVLILDPVPAAWRAPAVTGTPEVGRTLTADVGLWPTGDGDVTVQWLQNGQPIPGAHGRTYVVAPGDAGRDLAIEVTVGYGDREPGRATSAVVRVVSPPTVPPTPTVTPTPAPSRTTTPTPTPSVSPTPAATVTARLVRSTVPRSTKAKVAVTVRTTGAPAVGRLRVFAGSKQVASASVTAARKGSRTVTLPYLKVGTHTLTVRFDGAGTSATSAPRTLKVKKASAKARLVLVRSKVARTAKAKVKVTVSVAGLARPTGKVRIYDGKKKLRTITLSAKHRGTITVKLPRLKPGKHTIRATYSGSSQVKKATTPKKVLTVRR